MSDGDPRRAFESAGAFLTGHFVYTSGRHGADYLEKFRILEDPRATVQLAAMIADRFRPARPGLVAGPTTGGIILAYEVARQLEIKAVYAEPGKDGGRVLRRGFEIDPGARVLIVDDVVTTGASLSEMVSCIRETGGHAATQVPFFACLTLDFPSYAPESCPLCAAGVPLAAPRGSGRKTAPV